MTTESNDRDIHQRCEEENEEEEKDIDDEEILHWKEREREREINLQKRKVVIQTRKSNSKTGRGEGIYCKLFFEDTMGAKVCPPGRGKKSPTYPPGKQAPRPTAR